jgi:CRP-like cAMP-binding protein
MSYSLNHIINGLTPEIRAALEPHLKIVNLNFGDVVAEPGKAIDRVYFPHKGVISLVVVMDDGDMIETAMVGCDGAVNGACALDGNMSVHKGIVQVAGAASVIAPDELRKLAKQYDALQSIIIRNEQVILAQAQQSAGCNAAHTTESRMCRWLLRIRDLTGSDEMQLTQDFLAQMLGVRRTSVSLVASSLQTAGWIKYRRGHITITNFEGLKSGTCECYERVRSHYERLLA